MPTKDSKKTPAASKLQDDNSSEGCDDDDADDKLEDEKYDALKKLRGGHGNIGSVKGVLNLLAQGGSLYKSQTKGLAAEPEGQGELPFGESKQRHIKMTNSALNKIIQEEFRNVLLEMGSK